MKQQDAEIPDDPNHFHEAIEAFRRRVPLTEEEFAALEEAEQEFGFTVAGVAQADVVAAVYEAIDRAVSTGTTFEDFKDEIGASLSEAWGGESPSRLETVFRTNVMSSYNDGRYKVMTSAVVKEARPYWRADVIDDSRTSDICEDLIDVILPADDPFWSTHQPPLHPNCRSHLTPLSEEEAREEGVDTEPPDVDVADGFGRAPSTEGDKWHPDLEDYPAPIAEILRDRLG